MLSEKELLGTAMLGAAAWLRANLDGWKAFVRRHAQAAVDGGMPQTPEFARTLARKIGPFMEEDLTEALRPSIVQLAASNISRAELNATAAVFGAMAAQQLYGNREG